MNAGSASDAVREILGRQPLFTLLAPHWIDRLMNCAARRTLTAGDVLMREGTPSSSVYVILDGELEISRCAGVHDVTIATRGAGDLIGEMGLLAGTPRTATVRARGPATVFAIDGDAFMDALRTHPEALLHVLRTTMGRLQRAEADLVHHQKMAALGTLAAGLAHELNNPAAALARSVGRLRDAVGAWESAAGRLGAARTPEADVALPALRRDLSVRAEQAIWLDPIARADRVEQFEAWLRQSGIDEPWQSAPELVDTGWDVDDLRKRVETVSQPDLALVVEWLSAGQTTHRLLHELTVSARAISEIVAAVKAYTRLDQAPIADVDLHEGIDQSLTILRAKLRGVQVHREYAGDLPRIRAYGSELNQVWTNLIDNAADAMDGDGDLTIRTCRDGPWIAVEIADTGSGIPESIREHLFEPFATTKPPGRGTGMGLSIAYGIVRRHQGEIRVESRPGCTRFVVRLPTAGIKE
jgi:signal transduction histidine kinase